MVLDGDSDVLVVLDSLADSTTDRAQDLVHDFDVVQLVHDLLSWCSLEGSLDGIKQDSVRPAKEEKEEMV